MPAAVRPRCRHAGTDRALVAAISLQAALDARVAAAPGTGIVVGVLDHGVQKIYAAGSAGNGGRGRRAHTLRDRLGNEDLYRNGARSWCCAAKCGSTIRSRIIFPRASVRQAKTASRLRCSIWPSSARDCRACRRTWIDAAGGDPYADYTTSDMYAFLNGYTLTRDPGAHTSIRTTVSACSVSSSRTAPKRPIRNSCARAVLDPLGMSDSAFAMTGLPDPALLAVGTRSERGIVPTWHFQSVAPAGGIVSNVNDMLKFLRCNMGEGPLAKACLFAQRPRAEGEPRHEIGLVWNVNPSTGIISHGGDTLGFHAFVAISRDRKTGVVVLSNGPRSPTSQRTFWLPDYPIATCPSSVPASKTEPASYVGVYCNASAGMTFTWRTLRSPTSCLSRFCRNRPWTCRKHCSRHVLRCPLRRGVPIRSQARKHRWIVVDARRHRFPRCGSIRSGEPSSRSSRRLSGRGSVDFTAALQEYVGTYTAAGLRNLRRYAAQRRALRPAHRAAGASGIASAKDRILL